MNAIPLGETQASETPEKIRADKRAALMLLYDDHPEDRLRINLDHLRALSAVLAFGIEGDFRGVIDGDQFQYFDLMHSLTLDAILMTDITELS